MQSNFEYNFVYNDGDWQILEEEILKGDKSTEKYFQVLKDYSLIASFKDKKEALLWVGWRNTRVLKDIKDKALSDKELPKESLKEEEDVQS